MSTASLKKSNTPGSEKEVNVFLIAIGIIFIGSAVIIGLIIPCPSDVLYFIIYTLIGVGIALTLAKSAKHSKAKFTITNVKVVLVGGVALPFVLYYTNPMNSFKSGGCKLTATIVIQSIKGVDDLPLRKQGFVLMYTGQEIKKELIDDKGQASFKNLQDGDKIKLAIEFSEPFIPLKPDSIYIIHNDNSIINLLITLPELNKVKGTVIYNSNPLPGVTVRLEAADSTLIDTTDQTGAYRFSIPAKMQQDHYQLWFLKTGFQMKGATSHPFTGQPIDIVMEKL